jgi:hypothetical protein
MATTVKSRRRAGGDKEIKIQTMTALEILCCVTDFMPQGYQIPTYNLYVGGAGEWTWNRVERDISGGNNFFFFKYLHFGYLSTFRSTNDPFHLNIKSILNSHTTNRPTEDNCKPFILEPNFLLRHAL